MLRITNNFRILNLTKEVLTTDSNLINSQTVRWRKPRWVPIAKSKIFKVPPRPVVPEDEEVELKRLSNNYKTQIKSIRRYLSNTYYILGKTEIDPEEQKRQFEEDYARSMELNNKWNEEQKILREKRVAENLEYELNFARNRVQREILKRQEKLQLIEEIVRKEKEKSKSYITSENIDTAIEQALANPVDYNFAVNLNGEKVTHFEHEKKTEKKTSVIQ
ncbi:probable 28S ribosomal protein S26, mitochondrial [Anoplophora glabripennis]|uniref:probable 28S ribosomal protein S26, mitochondrial n=1 Tax=Anoplophora glabripennis TaxID=217634 RepID=UPI00087374CD|nr:probable 28S ribosomal protein S26, mitochondrial [Anoplophora glabripennis]